MVAAMSSGCPIRPTGICCAVWAMKSSNATPIRAAVAAVMSVWMKPGATAFAVTHEPIPKCTMPEFEVFLGEVAITPYETPGGQAFADTVIPYVKDTDTIILANHGTITCGSDLMDAYFKTEIIDAYCRILILAKQIGPIQYYNDAKAAELLEVKAGDQVLAVNR